jgi:hypothetical protein
VAEPGEGELRCKNLVRIDEVVEVLLAEDSEKIKAVRSKY